MKPFLKWAGGKRWLANRPEFQIPEYSGRYIEPFLGSGAIFFHHNPPVSLLSDLNGDLIETYLAIKENWSAVYACLEQYQESHGKDFYYRERKLARTSASERAAQFIYFNKTCWNGLYRVNRLGEFNVPIGTKTKVISPDDDLEAISNRLSNSTLSSCDFSDTIEQAGDGDLLFVDPPYTTAHNMNGFLKYNETIFSWEDQKRLRDCCEAASLRGAKVIILNADHPSVRNLYEGASDITILDRYSVISGNAAGRKKTSELLITLPP
ncbi:Dam family site-specific DNA-(adenine-N6)-methyltransferase [Mesorhizobium sp. M1148]|uniref:DNA adenine methylase n=1 Tax=unclassified Mesorhizobium TaxID=325217 RepID=UPI00333B476B